MTQTLAPTSFARQPLDVILARPTAIRVLRALILHGGPLSVARIAADARLTPGGVRGVIDELVAARMVDPLGSSRTQLYQVASTHPLHEALLALFRAEARRYENILSMISSEAQRDHPEVLAVWLFGSVARGEDNLLSDLDIAILIDATASRISEIIDDLRPKATLGGDYYGFQPSLVSIGLRDIPGMTEQGHRLWNDIRDHGRTVWGLSTSQALTRAVNERVGA